MTRSAPSCFAASTPSRPTAPSPTTATVRADPPVHELRVHALGLVAGLADLARVVGDHERPHHEVPDLQGAHLVADRLDDADVLMAHPEVVGRLSAAVRP
jgi:hypothetical protein